KDRFLYTHRGGKWSTFYSPDALALQARFFDCYLKGEENGMPSVAPVRLEVRATGNAPHAVRAERGWPVPGTSWQKLHLGPGTMLPAPPAPPSSVAFDAAKGGARFELPIAEDVELAGPMVLQLFVELIGRSDANLFVAVSKPGAVFEGAYGFGLDVV